ncbi:hypothetical protein BDZ90DRAFT_231285 [Jaminaea rosea]|uniref:Uncharacterized protein n=1 Tax=Jaminaea rosea TaxID=1569628 RepID=A0A316UVD5_9BASI|nr:hypothetical protein BDZ90DRAFT_231285 [Jaminaea rosea]PWN28291.1 hypothetical protein BDZ90DRAFT_231285 [Jaminaea rosea]
MAYSESFAKRAHESVTVSRHIDSPPALYRYCGPPPTQPPHADFPMSSHPQPYPPSTSHAVDPYDSHRQQLQPPEPTPPDSGRSKHFHEYDINRLVARDALTGLDVDESEQESSDGSSSQAQRSCASQSNVNAPILRRRAATRRLDEDYLQAEEEHRRGQQRASEWLSSDDESDQEQHRPSSTHRRRAHSSRKRNLSSSASPSASPSSSSSASPGVVWNRVPIRDTPNNPFLGGDHGPRSRNQAGFVGRAGDGTRGEDAARAHRRGLITYVFRGQRIVYADAPSDLEEDDDDLRRRDGSSRAPYRFEPKLLFPEAHAAEERRRRQRARAQQQREAEARDAAEQRRQQAAIELRQRQHAHNRSSSSLARFGGNLFAAELQRRQDQRAATGMLASQSMTLKRTRSAAMGGYEAEGDDEDDGQYGGGARGLPRPRLEQGDGQQNHRLLAQLDRVGWSDDDEDDEGHCYDRHEPDDDDERLYGGAAGTQVRCVHPRTVNVDEDYDSNEEEGEQQQQQQRPLTNPFDLAHHFQR